MGYDLRSSHGGFSVHWENWRPLLALAQQHGWIPAGTLPDSPSPVPDRPSNLDSYFGNDYQIVTHADARALGKALHHKISSRQRLLNVMAALAAI